MMMQVQRLAEILEGTDEKELNSIVCEMMVCFFSWIRLCLSLDAVTIMELW